MSSYKSKLEDWGLKEYVKIFEDEGITDESFSLIDDETISKIFLKSGPRLIFKRYFEKFLNTTKEVNAVEITTEVIECFSNNSTSTETISTSGSEIDLETSYLYEPDDETLKVIESLKCIENKSQFLKPQSPKRLADNVLIGEPSKRQRIDSVFAVGLEGILKKYTDGQIALANKTKVSNDCRQKIVRVIINELIASFGAEIRASTFLRVSEEIEQLFTNERANTYYIPYVPGGKNKKGYGPKGKLWSRYTNVRSALRNANNIKKTSEKENGNISPEKISTVETTHLEFLKIATEPYTKVLEAWEQTFKIRKRLYLNSDLDEIYRDFPCLKLNTGIELIETDFNKKYEGQRDIIYSTWPKISAAILKESEERHISIGTSDVFKDVSLNCPNDPSIPLCPCNYKENKKRRKLAAY